jgi:hypothetical protein
MLRISFFSKSPPLGGGGGGKKQASASTYVGDFVFFRNPPPRDLELAALQRVRRFRRLNRLKAAQAAMYYPKSPPLPLGFKS